MYLEKEGGTANPAVEVESKALTQFTSLNSRLQRPALAGLAGAFVDLVGPHTEADPAALLFQFLAAFGNAAGRRSYVRTDSSRQYPNLFLVIVGKSAKGRKGTSWGHVSNLFSTIDEDWFNACVRSGLTSGEGLIASLQDLVLSDDPLSINFPPLDLAPRDKRRLFVESEFAGLLRVLQRDGNTLSPVLRDAWDGSPLNVLTRKDPLRATGTHVSLIGHITETELGRYLSNVDLFNGFANRFLWIAASRVRLLPMGGRVPPEESAALAKQIRQAIVFAQAEKELLLDDEAEQLWCEIYRELSEEQPGLVGTVTARAEPLVRRLSLIYALLDCSLTVRRSHLESGLAAWKYAEQTCIRIFSASDDEDRVIDALEQKGSLTKTQVSALFGRNKSRTEIESLMSSLASRGKVRLDKEPSLGGRPVERWLPLLPGVIS